MVVCVEYDHLHCPLLVEPFAEFHAAVLVNPPRRDELYGIIVSGLTCGR